MADFQKVQEALDQKKQKRRPPESERYDELKGKRVAVVLGINHDERRLEPTLLGILQWVDRYTIGVHMESNLNGSDDQVWIVNKAKIVMIGEAG